MVPFAPAPSHLLDALLAPYELLRRVGSRPSPLYVVRHGPPGGKAKLFVAERFDGAARSGAGEWATFNAEARRISTLAASNVGRVRELAVRGEDLVAFWDFIDGERLIETWLSGMPFEVSLRVVLDVLSGVGAIHGLRDARQQPMDMAHGELSTATIVLGLDGTSRVLHAIARRLPGARAEQASLGYLAPEVHAAEAYGPSADVFSAGVLLWEALSGKRLFPEVDSATILAHVRHGAIPRAEVPGQLSWAKGLAAVAAKALEPSPPDRWPSVAAMAAEIRKLAGFKLASAGAAAAFAKAAIGERVSARRQILESGVDPVGATLPAQTVPVSAFPQPIDEACASTRQAGEEEGGRPVVPSASLDPEGDSPEPEDQIPAVSPASSVDTSGAHDFAAAFDVPASIPPPPDPFEVSPTSIETTGSFEPDAGATRRRRVAVLGGVGALGLIVFALAGWRAAHRDSGPPMSNSSRTVLAAAAVRPVPAHSPGGAPAHAAPGASSSPSVSPASPTPSTSVGATRASRTPSGGNNSTATKPASAAPSPPRVPVPSQAHSKPKANSGYDPNPL